MIGRKKCSLADEMMVSCGSWNRATAGNCGVGNLRESESTAVRGVWMENSVHKGEMLQNTNRFTKKLLGMFLERTTISGEVKSFSSVCLVLVAAVHLLRPQVDFSVVFLSLWGTLVIVGKTRLI